MRNVTFDSNPTRDQRMEMGLCPTCSRPSERLGRCSRCLLEQRRDIASWRKELRAWALALYMRDLGARELMKLAIDAGCVVDGVMQHSLILTTQRDRKTRRFVPVGKRGPRCEPATGNAMSYYPNCTWDEDLGAGFVFRGLTK